jgi:3-oxoadipate enol-lactonase
VAALETLIVGPSPRIAVDVAGSGSLVMFLHGIGGNRGSWALQLPEFARRYRAAAWDARGYGDSDDYDGPLDFADFSRDLARVLDHICERRAHLVGLSMGGRIARDFALRHPDRVATLTLANTSPGFDALSAEEVKAFLAARRAPLEAGKTPRDLAPELAQGLVGSRPSPGTLEALVASLSALRRDFYLKTLEASVTQDRAAPLERLSVPTLVVTSDEDRLYPPALAREMARRIPGAELVEIAGAGHITNIEQPEAFNRAVLDFLARRGGT